MSTWRDEYEVAYGGGVLRVREWGNPDGPLVVFHHGTPSSSVAVPGGWDAAARSSARICSFDRPGYGGSDREAGRTVADAARWSGAIADYVGRDRFAVVGTSGGGPHAAATAALLPHRVAALGVIVGLAPAGVGFDAATDMLPETVAEIRAALQGETAMHEYVESLGDDANALEAWMLQLPPSDQAVLGRPEVQREEAVEGEEWGAQGRGGWIDDDLALFGVPWGFDPGAISCPTQLLFGDADVLVPPSHGRRWAEVVPHAEMRWIAAGGHWLRDTEPEVIDWLAAQVLTGDVLLG